MTSKTPMDPLMHPQGDHPAGGGNAHAVFAAELVELSRPGAYVNVEDHVPIEPIEVIHTHASAVLLTAQRAYKLKKPNNFGFFDYSTSELRRHYCGLEVQLNARMAPGIYLGLSPVLRYPSGRYEFAVPVAAEHAPAPGSAVGSAVVVDYAVVMMRLPESATLHSLVRDGFATPELLGEVARYVAAFHAGSHAEASMIRYGMLDTIRGNWEENFEQTSGYVDRCIDQATYDEIARWVRAYVADRATLFADRVASERIRDCHGDLRLQHVYVLPPALKESAYGGGSAHRLAVLDRIEFNDRFRFGDVTGEVAFLAMELDAAGRADLSRTFVQAYVHASGDSALLELLSFYCCYRAYVRGKVVAFQLDEPEVPAEQRESATREARELFELARRYASGPSQPVVLMVGGVMGTGKTTLANALSRELGWPAISSDTTRKRLAGLDPRQPIPADFGGGIYSDEWTLRTYQTLADEAQHLAREHGRSVILDASFSRRDERELISRQASEAGAAVVFVEATCARDIALQRLARRWEQRQAGVHTGEPSAASAAGASDGRPALFDQQAAHWEPLDAPPGVAHVRADTGHLTLTQTIEQILHALDLPRLACWLHSSTAQ